MAVEVTASLCVFLGCFMAFSSALVTTSCDIFQQDLPGLDGALHTSCPSLPTIGSGLLARCTNVNHLEIALKEVPRNVETLCFIGLSVKNISEGIFLGLDNLTALYLQGSFFVWGGAFRELISLRYLVIMGGWNIYNYVKLDNGVFQGLEALTHLKLDKVFIDVTIQPNVFKPLKALQAAFFFQNEIHRLYFLTRTLASLTALEILVVNRNGILATREGDCIESQTPSQPMGFSPVISTLDLTSNGLHKVEYGSLCNFKHLKVFKVDATFLKVEELLQSGIEEVEALSLNAMKNIDYISMLNVCKVVEHLKVRNLTAAQNFIGQIDPKSLEGCSGLLSLNLSDNILRSFSGHLVQKLPSIMFLLLSHNKIKTLDLCQSGSGSVLLRNLIHLDLSLNRITDLGTQQLSCVPALLSLDLSSNHIVDLKNSAFLGLDRLEVLNLESNGLFILENFYFEHLPTLKVLGLKGNQLKNHNQSFNVLTQLEELSLSFEDMGTFYAPHPHLTKLQLEGYNIETGCLQNCSTMKKVEIKAPLVHISTCKSSPFVSVMELHLEDNHEVICLPLGTTDCYTKGLRSFPNVQRVLYSSSAELPLTKVSSPLKDTLSYLPNLRHLHLINLRKDFENGFLIPDLLFHNLTSLSSLILEDSGIEHFSSSIFSDLSSLELLIIKSQEMKTLQEGLFDGMDRLKYLYLTDVHLDCSCDQAWISGWLATHTKVRSPKTNAINCSLGSLKMNWLNFLEKHCSPQYQYYLFIGTFSFHAIFILAALLYHKVRLYLRYLLHMLRTWWNYRGRRDGRQCYDFDAFVSYSSHDECWVVNEFLPNLEEQGPPFFKVCLHGRDFELGKDILDNIVDSIYRSRRTICLVSHHFLRSHWCSMEMRMATYRLIAERENTLIIVFLEKISTRRLSRYHQMARLVKKKTYLEWTEDVQEQPLFWARLRKAIGEDEVQEVVDE
ncbi:toll-like receptor 13 [Microcaecilia unicolor]|uniref:Toll-like receptor 13 n=1 Tax=Microcaecilia unicolor TaxID=1415580 RepID=A0A6P7X4P6_9AMPH|nr:toll-like receptor 13 [Microcaecilia unicolor]